MSLLNIMNVGKLALFANQSVLNVTAHNMANVNTPGYTKQSVVLQIARPMSTFIGFLGRGVNATHIVQNYSRFIESQLLGQRQNFGKASVMSDVMSQVEQVFNSFIGSGLSGSLQSFLNSWSSLSADPSSFAHRTVLLSDANALVSVAKQMEGDLQRSVREIDRDISATVGRINEIADGIARLNKEIVKIEAGNSIHKANDLRDMRGSLVSELAELVQISTLENSDGALQVIVGMRNLVDVANVGKMTSGTDAFGNISLKIDNFEIASRIDKGRLGGLIESRKAIEEGPLKALRKLAASITQEINRLHVGGYGLDGSTGNEFFAPLTLGVTNTSAGASITATVLDQDLLTLSEYDVTIGAANAYTVTSRDTGAVVASGTFSSGTPISFDGMEITLTGTVVAGDSFSVSPLTNAISNFATAFSDINKIAAASSPTSLPGDNTNALLIAALGESSIASLGGATTFQDFYARIVTMTGSMSADAMDMYRFETNVQSQLQDQRDSVSGVSIDEEAAALIIYQRAFEAAARMINVADELLQTVLNLGA